MQIKSNLLILHQIGTTLSEYDSVNSHCSKCNDDIIKSTNSGYLVLKPYVSGFQENICVSCIKSFMYGKIRIIGKLQKTGPLDQLPNLEECNLVN